MVEGRGIGHTLATLIIIHAENTGHNHVTLYTEEQDEKGRKLRRFYQKMGFIYLGTEPEKGDVMVMKLNPEDTTKASSTATSKPLRTPPIATPPTLNKNIPQPPQPLPCRQLKGIHTIDNSEKPRTTAWSAGHSTA